MKKNTYHLPQAILDRLNHQFGVSTTARILQGFSYDRAPTFRANTLKINDDGVMEVLREKNIRFERIKSIAHAFRVFNITEKELLALPMFLDGKAYLQGQASMMPVFALDPKEDETVLDLCAAPGSKTTQIAAMMHGKGKVVACEVNEVRYQRLRHNLEMQGAKNVEAKCMDSALLHKEYPEAFDKVLADVPCSAEGRISLSDPRTYRFWSQKNIVAHAKMQRRLLKSAVRCLKKDGEMVYSTCTLAPEENEEMIAWLLKEYPQMQLMGAPQRFLPNAEHEGFFVAHLRKITSMYDI